MARKKFSIKKLIANLMEKLKNYKKFRTKFSKKTFTIAQIIVLKTLKEVLHKSYDELVDFLEDFKSIGKLIKLKRIPDPSTIRKYGERIGLKRIIHLDFKDLNLKWVHFAIQCCIVMSV